MSNKKVIETGKFVFEENGKGLEEEEGFEEVEKQRKSRSGWDAGGGGGMSNGGDIKQGLWRA